MRTNLTVIGVLIFCISAGLVIPKVADATGNLRSSLSVGGSTDTSSITQNPGENLLDSQELYVPPNFGGPDSQHGSGTR
ncbi:hypothetical protein [Anabaena azotica]|uniref:Secreted protein n=1 Tax=Anabaena azotica FACHB-119 TaxID=947527 RepID=A0ABR8D6R5_9NOST|nr:hypothetical protein [Anabaena azotica]MBD2502862.1 hypothetical protein [Anabaena azotica FACHB-119]